MPSLFPEPPVPETLRTPSEHWVSAHCDGGARGNPGPAGYGAVLVDEEGHTLAELSEFLGVRTNNVAEYSGLLAVLGWTLEHGFRRLKVTSDSLLMVKQVKGQYKVNSPDLKPLWEEARRRARQLDAFEITHALRHKNKVADRLANEAMDRGMGRPRRDVASIAAPPASSRGQHHLAEAPETVVKRRADPGVLPAAPESVSESPLRGLVRDGVVRLLGGRTLPEGAYVRITPE